MTENLSAFLYLISSICFIMALKGLSSPDSARQGNMFGIAGMAIAILTTLAMPEVMSYGTILAGIVIGGSIGAFIARKIEMTALPQLVAAFHSLVGLAACFVAAAAFFRPEAYGIGTPGDHCRRLSCGNGRRSCHRCGHLYRLDHRLWQVARYLVRGAGDLQRSTSAECGARNSAGGAGCLVVHRSESDRVLGDPACAGPWYPDHHPDWRGRHAGCDLDAELLFRLGCLRHRLYPWQLCC